VHAAACRSVARASHSLLVRRPAARASAIANAIANASGSGSGSGRARLMGECLEGCGGEDLARGDDARCAIALAHLEEGEGQLASQMLALELRSGPCDGIG
jgi:hypothetical protein